MRIVNKYLLSACLAMMAVVASAQGPGNSGNYYKAADGKKGAALKTALCGIIYNRTERTYKQLWEDFKTTDKRPDGKVWDMYSCITNYTFGTDQAGNYKKEGDVYNREHSFPASWFNDNKPMYTDLFHLYPTDGYVNNQRGNLPFGTNNGEKYMSAQGFSKVGNCTYPGYSDKVFEPNDEYKGDFARTYFYMVTCYEEKLPDWYKNYPDVKPTLDGKKYPGLSAWQLQMLLEWAALDPVSEKETDRNEAVYGIQKNRNPFIDYPGLEQYIWGDKQDVPFDYTGLHDEPVIFAGDVNDDGKVDVSDYIGVANHILGDTPAGFNAQAADVNNDGNIDVSDYIGIANIILTGSPFGNSSTTR